MVRAPSTQGLPTLVASLFLIVSVALVLRLPGLFWLQDVKPDLQYSLHPDESHLLRYAAHFEDKPRSNYVLGFSASVYVIREIGRFIFDTQLDLVLVGRIISITSGLLLLVLTGVIVYLITGSTARALLSSAFLATMPLHVIQSDFAVVDSTAILFLYLSLWAVWQYLKTQALASLIWFAVCIGIVMAFKFYLPLALPFAVVAFLSRHDFRNLALLGSVSLLSFLATNFFSLTPWDFARFMKLILFDNVVTVAGNSPWDNFLYYAYELPVLVGLGVLPFLLWGVVVVARELYAPALCRFRDVLGRRAYTEVIRQPAAVIAATFLLHALSVLAMNVCAARHILPFFPLLAYAAAAGFLDLASRLQLPRSALVAGAAAVLAYQTYNASMIGEIFRNDIRGSLAAWLGTHAPDARVGDYIGYAGVKGVSVIDRHALPSVTNGLDYLVTCNTEYGRYVNGDDASQIYHAYGGQAWLEFFQDLLAGRAANFQLVESFERRPYGIEQRLAKSGYLGDLSGPAFVPDRCLVFGKRADASR